MSEDISEHVLELLDPMGGATRKIFDGPCRGRRGPGIDTTVKQLLNEELLQKMCVPLRAFLSEERDSVARGDG